MLIVICGVSGCGKTTIARELAKRLDFEFADADDYHSEENKALMRNGISLTDKERLPWLLTLHDFLAAWHENGVNGILACSALRQKYRHLLNSSLVFPVENKTGKENGFAGPVNLNLLFVCLNVDKEVIGERIAHRTDHDVVKDARLVDSQFATLELPPKSDCLWTGSSYDFLEFNKEISINNEFKRVRELINFVKNEENFLPSAKTAIEFLPNYENLSTIYLISRINVEKKTEKADMTRFLNTIRLIPKITWIVVENTPTKSEKIKKFLQKSGIKYVHLNRYAEHSQLVKNLSLEQFDEGLNWLRTNYQNIHQNGVVHLARIQTSYDTKVFELMRQTKRVMVWPVGMVNNSLYSRPICIKQKVVSWYCPWKCDQDLYPIHESAFALNLRLLIENKNALFSHHREHGDFFVSYFIKSLTDMQELEAPECYKIYVRNVETGEPRIVFKHALYDPDFLRQV